jgi:biopolymer transport protein ExbD
MALKRSSETKAEFSMSSLTDIIFLLLIFFMLTSSFVTINALNLHLPKAEGSPVKKDPQPIQVSITKDLEYFIGTTKYEFSEIPDVLNDMLLTEYNTREDRGTIIINVDESVPTGETTKVLAIGQKLQAKVILATEVK